MLYYRRKLILALLEVFGGKLSAIQLQKYLFLVTRLQTEKSFFFVPFKYGCFSFQANQDIATLATYSYISVNGNDYQLNDLSFHFLGMLNLFDQQYVLDIFERFGKLSQDELIKYTYLKYPFYAINSSIAPRVLSANEISRVNAQRRKKDGKQLFTIGYQGVSLEQYVNKLIIEDVHVLCDVRKNAFSQKYGFSKSQLEKACNGVDIQYIHIPALGIESNKRQELHTQNDYDLLFEEYERNVLPYQQAAISLVHSLIEKYKRVALTCFEKDPLQCHRTRVANAVMKMANNEYTLKQIVF